VIPAGLSFKMYMRPFSLFLCTLLVACTHKSFVPHVPPVVIPVCDTINISYGKDVQPVLRNNCYSCHATAATASAGGGLDLENFASLKSYLNYGFRGDGVYGSKFYHCITHSLLALPMPPTYIIDTCALKQVKRWIDLGAPQN
jgi:hypothetical protein